MKAVAVVIVLSSLANALWPMPRTLSTGSQYVKLSHAFGIHVDIQNPPRDLLEAVDRTTSYLWNDRLGRLIVGRGSNDTSALAHAPSLSALTLSLSKGMSASPIAQEAVLPLENRSESYSLTVPADGSGATLTANSTLGLLRGLTTFTQLWYYVAGTVYTYEAPIDIPIDYPAYPYRGFMLDTARNYFPVSDIERTLDAMSWSKINMFHWHIVDAQSFPLEISEYPELATYGAYSPSEVYTPTDIQNIVAYAGARGIDVLMEIDTPGHTTSIGMSYPEYIACFDESPWTTYANEPPAGQLRIADPATVNFTADMLASVAKTLPSSLFSIGGDEVNTNCYTNDSLTQRELQESGKTFDQALSDFVQSNQKALAGIGKTPVVWEEMVLSFNVSLAPNTVVMVWISSADAAAVAAQNFRIVHAPSNYFYLDCGAGGWLGNDSTGNSWCDPFKTWQYAYTFDPLANLTSSQASLVLGGEQLLWTEQSGPENLDPIVWPRAASSAEIFWTGATLPDGSPRNVDTALPRLHDLRYRMVNRGIRAIPLQPQWCALRPYACDL